MLSVRGWIEGDENAKEMLVRVLTERSVLHIPPLQRIPLRVGNVVEIVGPSPTAMSDILIQAAIGCILPREWNGLNYGGLERSVMFLDLECHFDILQLSQLLKHRIIENYGSSTNTARERHNDYDKRLFDACMKRFSYIRCYDTSEFLATVKTMQYQLQKKREKQGSGVHLLLIDSIGAFYWIDRALPLGLDNRKHFSLQTVSETVVQEIRKLLMLHPMLVLVTRIANVQDKHSANKTERSLRKATSLNASDIRTGKVGSQIPPYCEYMPSVWQSLVTHRILVQASDDESGHQNHPTFLSEWLLPSLGLIDKFIVTDAGVFIVS